MHITVTSQEKTLRGFRNRSDKRKQRRDGAEVLAAARRDGGEGLREDGRRGSVQGRREGVIVEVDECWVMKEKDGTDVWVVGVIEREVTIDGEAGRQGRWRSSS